MPGRSEFSTRRSPLTRSRNECRAFRQGLKDTGYVEGENVTIQYRAGPAANTIGCRRWRPNWFRRPVAVLAAAGRPNSASLPAARQTTTIPIVFAVGEDPGQLTGVTFFANELGAKRLGLLREMLPRATVIAVLLNSNFPDAQDQLRNVQEAARTLGLQIAFSC